MMRRSSKRVQIGHPRSMSAKNVAETGKDGGLIERDPVFNAVSEAIRSLDRILAEPAGNIAIGKSSPILQRLGQIPMKQSDKWRYPRLQKLIDQAIVKIEAALVWFSLAFG